MPRQYQSRRVGLHHPPWRPYGAPPPPPTFQVVQCWPPDRACPSRLAVVGEGPGADEDQAGYPFVGRSGEELDRFLCTYHIDPDDCLITNIGRVWRPGNPDPTADDIATWESLLQEELNAANPIWIAAVGRISTRYFLGDVDMGTVHGIPYLVVLPWLDNGRGGRVVVVPVVHPAAGFHNTELQAATAYDFSQLNAVVTGRLEARMPSTADRYPNPVYRDITDEPIDLEELEDAVMYGEPEIAVDTEGLPRKPWGLSFCNKPGTAFVIRRVHAAAIIKFDWCLKRLHEAGTLHILLHNSLHDLRVLRELATPIPGRFTDTMVLAYHLCIEPQGLKALAYRHCGMEMDSYDEIVQEAADKIALEYYRRMHAAAIRPAETFAGDGDRIWQGNWSRFPRIMPYEVLERDKETGQLKARIKKPQQVEMRVVRAMKDFAVGKLTAAGLRKRWGDTDESVTEIVESVIGVMREPDLDDVPLDRAIHYAARDADATKRIYPLLKAVHTALGLTQVSDIDHAIIPMVDQMQAVGMEINRPYLQSLSTDLGKRMVSVQQDIKEKYGVWINPNSGDQVAELLFGDAESGEGGYGLIPTKRTKGTVDKETGDVKKRRGSTQDKVLEGMRDAHPIIPMILDYRGLSKAKSSFCDVAIRLARREGGRWVVHCNFRITRVSSGRLSATAPNLLAVMGGDLGKEIRTGYIAGEGWMLITWDLNQIEMRGMASESGDEFLIGMFMADEDVHTGTADKMFKLNLKRPYSKKQVGKEQRDPAKRTGFGVITGIQAQGLVDQMRLQGVIVSEEEAASWIIDWLAACPAVPEYMHRCHREAMAYGYVRDWAGRIRYLPGIHSPFKHIRAEAGRQSHSHKIQAGAQEIMKRGMATIDREVIPYWASQGKPVVPVLQVHDELMVKVKVADFPPGGDALEELNGQMRAAMFAAAPDDYRVPLDAGMAEGATWGDIDK